MTLRITAIVAGIALLAGCATVRVQPWERDVLALQAMQLDAYPLDIYLDDHIYFSKESANGGQGIGGGGCGCN